MQHCSPKMKAVTKGAALPRQDLQNAAGTKHEVESFHSSHLKAIVYHVGGQEGYIFDEDITTCNRLFELEVALIKKLNSQTK